MADLKQNRSRSEGHVKIDRFYKNENTNRSIPDIAAGTPLMEDIQGSSQESKGEVRGNNF